MSFCFYCGTGPVSIDAEKECYYCSICGAVFNIIKIRESPITLEEAQAIFDKMPIPLKKGRQRRNKRYKVKDDTDGPSQQQEIGAV